MRFHLVQVTLLVWPAPRNIDSDDEAGRITSYFSSSSANASYSTGSVSSRVPREKKEERDDDLARALQLSLEEEQKRKRVKARR